MESKYGYIINLNYQTQPGVVIWDIFINDIFFAKGIEGVGLETNENFVIIGNAQEFNNWLSIQQTPANPLIF